MYIPWAVATPKSCPKKTPTLSMMSRIPGIQSFAELTQKVVPTCCNTHCNTLLYTAPHCNTHCNTHCDTLQHTTALQHTHKVVCVCGMTHSYVWHDSCMCVTWLIHMCVMTLVQVQEGIGRTPSNDKAIGRSPSTAIQVCRVWEYTYDEWNRRHETFQHPTHTCACLGV